MIDLITENEDAWKKYGFTVYPSKGDFISDPSGSIRRSRAMRANLASIFLENYPDRINEFKNSNGKIVLDKVVAEAESVYWSSLPSEYRIFIVRDAIGNAGKVG